MRKGRPALVIALLLSVLPLAVLAWVVSSGDRSIRAAQWLVSAASPYSLSLTDASLTWRPFRFRAGLLQLRYADPGLPPLFAGQKIDLEMPLATLWGGDPREGSFDAHNLTYYLDESSDGGELDFEALVSPLGWLPGQVDIDSVHVIHRGDNVWVFPLLNVAGRRAESGSLAVNTEAHLGSRRVMLEAVGDWSLAEGAGHWLTIEAALFGVDDASRLELSGRVETDDATLRYELTLDGEYQRVGDFLAALDGDAFGLDGALSIRGRLSGDTEGSELLVEELTLTQEDSYRFAADGRILQRRDGAPRLELAARGNVRRLRQLLPIPEILAPLIDRSELELTIAGTLRQPLLEALGLALYGTGDTRITVTSPALSVDLARLRSLDSLDGMALHLKGSSEDLPALLAAAGVAAPSASPSTASLTGELRVEGDELRAKITSIDAAAGDYTVHGVADALWRTRTLSLPQVEVTVLPRDLPGEIRARGSIADLLATRGLALDVTLTDLDPRLLERISSDAPALPEGIRVDASGRVLRAAGVTRVRDLQGSVSRGAGLNATFTGDMFADLIAPDGDIDFALTADARSYADFGLPTGPHRATGRLRLRPNYLTTLATMNMGASDLQAVANADLADGALASLAIDVWGENTRLEDFIPPEPDGGGDGSKPKNTKAADGSASGPAVWTKRLPRVPLHLTLRSQRLYSEHAELRDVALSIEGDSGSFVLRNFDSRYDDGDLSLRGILDLNTAPPSLSLAGRAIRVPLGALTEDLGLQQSISGELSLQGGLSAQGIAVDELSRSLRGQLAVALSDMTVSGAAYDLLMSNLLAWLVQGAAEKTTTFDCTMMHFDVEDGVAKTDGLYVETPRMLATGKGRIDLPGQHVDFRLEPRSKSRTVQFPSALRIRGPLGGPSIEVSGLQATADLSAQTLLLLPSLTLKLFGVGADDDAPRPCRAVIDGS